MENLPVEQLQQRLKDLEKQNRLLQKKLKRSEANRLEIENSYEIQSRLVSQVIQGLEQSQQEAEQRNQELQQALDDLRVMQTKLVESEKMSALGVLVAGLAHEINNPINFIHVNIGHTSNHVQNLIEVLNLYQNFYPQPAPDIADALEDLDLDFVVGDLSKLLNSMRLGSARIRNIVLGLRTFARVGEAEYKQADLHQGLDSALMILQHRFNANKNRGAIEVIKQYGQLPKVLCFPGQLNQMFMTILVNAIDAIEEDCARKTPADQSGKNPCITIRTSASDRWIEVAIADNGAGMSKEVQKKIFNPFYTTKLVGKGMGMGLAIAYQIAVEKHGGQLDCYSKVGEGTEFQIRIPVKPE